MRYSDGFNRDFKWYMIMRHIMTFDGKHPADVIHDRNGVDAKKAFHIYDSQGKMVATKHPNLLQLLIKTKGSINLHIKMYAEDRAALRLPGLELRGMAIKWGAPDWFRKAIEAQRYKYSAI